MNTLNPTIDQNKTQQWFDELVHTLRVHEIQLETGTAPEERQRFYSRLMLGNTDELTFMSKQLSQRHFVVKIIADYLALLDNNLPNKLAFDFNDSMVLVWAEINDDDEQAEDRLILSEAKINAKYHQYGFDMESTIVEASDKLPVPNHYRLLK